MSSWLQQGASYVVPDLNVAAFLPTVFFSDSHHFALFIILITHCWEFFYEALFGLIYYFVKKQMTTEQQVLWLCHLAAWQLDCQDNENTKSSNCVLTGMGHNSMCQVEACWWASSLASDLTQALILSRQSALALVLAVPNNNYKLYFSAKNDISTTFPKQIRQNYYMSNSKTSRLLRIQLWCLRLCSEPE